MEHLSNDQKDCHSQHRNSHMLWDKVGRPVVSLTEIQWKLRQQHDQDMIVEQNTGIRRNK